MPTSNAEKSVNSNMKNSIEKRCDKASILKQLKEDEISLQRKVYSFLNNNWFFIFKIFFYKIFNKKIID
jgi:hypothetical protein